MKIRILLAITLIGFAMLLSSPVIAQSGNRKVYIPAVFNSNPGFSTSKKFLGIYLEKYWTDGTVPDIQVVNNLAGKKHAVVGWFIDLQNIAFTSGQTDIRTNNFYRQLEALWEQGYVSFLNLQSGAPGPAYLVNDNCLYNFKAYEIAAGMCDRAIQQMANLYKQWIAVGGGRKAFIAPLQEMNGVNADGSQWVTYAGDPANYKLAYAHIQDVFTRMGVTRDQVWWVFAPNGWSPPEHNFENYYPGDSKVDVVSFSSYNFGFCWVMGNWKEWTTYNEVFEPYIKRFSQLSPSKPVIIAQTGTTAEYNQTGVYDVSKKNGWLKENYQWLASQPSVLGVIYFDIGNGITNDCRWRISENSTDYAVGYRDGAAFYQALTQQDLRNIIGK